MSVWFLEWGRSGSNRLERLIVSDAEELESALVQIELSAMMEAYAFQVDIWTTSRPDHNSPIYIQCLVGDPERGCLLWHTDGETWIAASPKLPELDRNIPYMRTDGIYCMEPDMTRIRPESVRDSLIVYFLTNTRIEEGVEWSLAPAD